MIRWEQSYSLVKVIAKIFLLCVEFMIQDVYHIALIKEEAFWDTETDRQTDRHIQRRTER